MTVGRSTALRFRCVATLLLLATEILAFQPLQRLLRRPFFALERTLPPLASTQDRLSPSRRMLPNATIGMGSPSTWTLPYSNRQEDLHGEQDNLQVLYTNDPKEINRWLTDNLSMDGCTIGFDTEVGWCLLCHSIVCL